LERSDNLKKKMMVHIEGTNKHIKFGSNGLNDYIFQSNYDKEHSNDMPLADLNKKAYIKRHKKRENWNDPNTPGFWSKNILWSKPTLDEAIKYTENKHKIKIINKIQDGWFFVEK
jgi:hypothetical protein